MTTKISKITEVHKHTHTHSLTTTTGNDIVRVSVSVVHVYPFLPLSDSSLTHRNLAAVLETVEVGWQLEDCLKVPLSVWMQQCDNDEERRNELISWWLQYSPYALDSFKWLSGRLLWLEEESALAAAKRYVHQIPGMNVVNYRHAHLHSVVCCVIMVKGHHKPSPY